MKKAKLRQMANQDVYEGVVYIDDELVFGPRSICADDMDNAELQLTRQFLDACWDRVRIIVRESDEVWDGTLQDA